MDGDEGWYSHDHLIGWSASSKYLVNKAKAFVHLGAQRKPFRYYDGSMHWSAQPTAKARHMFHWRVGRVRNTKDPGARW